MSVLVVSKILRPFVNTLTPNDKYALDNSEILKKLIQIGLSNEPKIFSPFFAAVLKSPFNFQHFKKKDEPQSFCISQIMHGERRAYLNV